MASHDQPAARRIASLSEHIDPAKAMAKAAVGGPGGIATGSSASSPVLMNDEQMKEFVSKGYTIFQVDDITPEMHETIYQKTKKLYRVEDGGGAPPLPPPSCPTTAAT